MNTPIYMRKVSSPHWHRMRSPWPFEESLKKLNCMPKQSKTKEIFFSTEIRELLFVGFRGYNVTEITLTLDGTTAYPKVYQSLCTMLTKKALNPADVTSVRQFFGMLIDRSRLICHSSIKSINPTMHHRLI